MSGIFLLDWAALAVSLFNTITLLWLGLTVLLNAERRTLGLWVSGGMLLLGSVFFLSHSAILGHGSDLFSQGINFWWHLGWFPVVYLPLAWYAVMLWYSGFWSQPQSRLRRRHRAWLWLVTSISVGVTAMLFIANPLPTFPKLIRLNLAATPSIGGIPLLVLVYILYIVLCISLSLDALRQPAQSERVMGNIARQRARPWLASAAALELVVSLLVGWAMLSILKGVQENLYNPAITRTIIWFDLTIASTIGLTIILLGQAIVSYEVFTGKTLPRRGLARYWRRVLILAAGFGGLVSLGLVLPMRPIYILLLCTLLITIFYALLSWRSFEDRESAIRGLRPFVTSQRLFDQLSAHSEPSASQTGARATFHALCADVLGTNAAYLVPLGSPATLAGPALVYPEDATPCLPALAEISARFSSSQSLCGAVDPELYAGAAWVVPLWSDQGLIGLFLLGDKHDASLYTQEEIEIARTAGERLVDALASAELARRLMTLQRQRLAESQVLDRQTRRILHDDVLPELHAAMLSLDSQLPNSERNIEEVLKTLSDLYHQVTSLLHGLPPPPAPELSRHGFFGGLQQVVAGEFKGSFDKVTWNVSTEAETQARELSPLVEEVIFYAAREAIRNAARHARPAEETAPLQLYVNADYRDGLEIAIEDNGGGFYGGTSIEDGSGQGLALHSTLMAVSGGSLEVESLPGKSTRVLLRLPSKHEDIGDG